MDHRRPEVVAAIIHHYDQRAAKSDRAGHERQCADELRHAARRPAKMSRANLALALVAAWLAAMAPAGAQDVRTQAPCSPAIDRTQGSVTINFAGGCTAGLTAAQLQEIKDAVLASRTVPPELLDRYEGISRQFGVTDAAVTAFFRILGEKKVAIEDLDAKLREIAAKHLTLLKETEAQTGDDPQVVALKKQAVAEIDQGNYARAEALLRQAADVDLVAIRKAEDVARKAQDAANQRRLSAAKSKA